MHKTMNPPDPHAGRAKIAYIPMEDVGNEYTTRMRELLAGYGDVVRYEGTRAWALRLLKGRFWRYDYAVLNWMENEFVDLRSGRISWKGFAKVLAKTMVIKAGVRRLVYVRHNNYPHAAQGPAMERSRKLVDWYCRLFANVVSHSGALTAAGAVYCPHPLYRLAEQRDADLPRALPEEYFVVFGRISRYKKIEQLIAAFPANRNLVVAGAVADEAYAQSLLALRRDNVIVMPGKLSEAQAQKLVSGARGVVISHADADVVVSGTFFYAMSVRRPVFAIETPFLRWVAPRVGDELVRLGRDMRELCAAIAAAAPVELAQELSARIEEQFGDEAVRRALGLALGRGA
ncbi:glycosyltransferase involved in cell wall biosynthesis [Herbaspirillum sp. SJZ130]|nr:glycosyltransferase involved in cell wall biosynthesis [Herbaspirillum sp. SJZ130]TQK09734.1 glycosyltransferase involved in cell wall biosynthesis [Herbaspirillum sp. SJZ106]TWC65916.1 glycosyltransferase involved in cell wall biosynthesis [Herbaspirillum sp. SJZ099]